MNQSHLILPFPLPFHLCTIQKIRLRVGRFTAGRTSSSSAGRGRGSGDDSLIQVGPRGAFGLGTHSGAFSATGNRVALKGGSEMMSGTDIRHVCERVLQPLRFPDPYSDDYYYIQTSVKRNAEAREAAIKESLPLPSPIKVVPESLSCRKLYVKSYSRLPHDFIRNPIRSHNPSGATSRSALEGRLTISSERFVIVPAIGRPRRKFSGISSGRRRTGQRHSCQFPPCESCGPSRNFWALVT